MRLGLLAALLYAALGHAEGEFVRMPGGDIRSVLKYEDTQGMHHVVPFELMRYPVTNAQFLDFVEHHPQWQRDRVPAVFAEPAHYLNHWAQPLRLGDRASPQQPVVQVSWFAASAYCESIGARLPTWAEWEYSSAADETRGDARSDPQWRERILGWYAQPSNAPLAAVGQRSPNVYGVHDLHGLVWEWTEDYASMLVSADNRSQSEADRLKFCGAAAISMEDKENYAILMRVAMLSALEAANSTANLGFRCARSLPQRAP